MSNDSNNPNNGARTLSGGPIQSSRFPSSSGLPRSARIGRIGDWSGSGRAGSSGGTSRIGTMADLNPGSDRMPPQRKDDDDDEEQRESWFTGGERSGLSVQNPDRQTQVPGGDLVRDLLRRAAEGGPAPAASPRSFSFNGGAHRLGGDDQESEYIPSSESLTPEQTPQIRHLTFWRNGFSVESGPLMGYNDPGNTEILNQINSGLAPPSVLNVDPGQPVEVRIARRTNEDYTPPVGGKVFSGTGNRLGAPVHDVASADLIPRSFSTPIESGSSSDRNLPLRESISTRFEVDQALPTTSVQIRLADGTRMVCRMNHKHKVQDIRNFINASHPNNMSRDYTIGTGFPFRPLDNNDDTIEDAGLLNSVVEQRLA